jgi:hypothetical protein
MQSFKPEVKVDGVWSSNGLRFATKEEAERSASNLFSRWTVCTAHRAAESNEPVKNALNAEGKLQFLVDDNEAQGGGGDPEEAERKAFTDAGGAPA